MLACPARGNVIEGLSLTNVMVSDEEGCLTGEKGGAGRNFVPRLVNKECGEWMLFYKHSCILGK